MTLDGVDDKGWLATTALLQPTATQTCINQTTKPKPTHQAELTRALINAKVEVAESNGLLLRMVRDLRWALHREAPAAAKVVELEAILRAWHDDHGHEA